MDQVLAEVQVDKVSAEVPSPADGVVHLLVPEEAEVAQGTLIATVEPSASCVAAHPEHRRAVHPVVQQVVQRLVRLLERVRRDRGAHPGRPASRSNSSPSAGCWR